MEVRVNEAVQWWDNLPELVAIGLSVLGVIWALLWLLLPLFVVLIHDKLVDIRADQRVLIKEMRALSTTPLRDRPQIDPLTAAAAKAQAEREAQRSRDVQTRRE